MGLSAGAEECSLQASFLSAVTSACLLFASWTSTSDHVFFAQNVKKKKPKTRWRMTVLNFAVALGNLYATEKKISNGRREGILLTPTLHSAWS